VDPDIVPQSATPSTPKPLGERTLELGNVLMARTASLNTPEIANELRRLGFEVGPMGSKSQPATRGSLDFYLKKTDRETEVLVINPSFADRFADLLSISGVHRSAPADMFNHNTSYRAFPKRFNGGKTPINYGLDFGVETPEALRALVGLLLGQPIGDASSSTVDFAPIVAEVDAEAETDLLANEGEGIDPKTETEVTRAARLGQSRFRADLLKRWSSKCALIGLEMPELLRASHIKPWCDSSDRERLDPDNGLLLAVHIDVLFDGGLISFADDGAMLVSTKLSSATCVALGIDRALSIAGLSDGNRRYLAIHRDVYFQRTGS
jgi:putative restriction endonuclease